MKKELFPVKADGGYIFDAHGASIAMFHATEWNKTTGGVHVHDVTQNAKDIASALNNTWGQGINPEALPAMYDYINQYAKKDFPDAAAIIKQATLKQPEKDITGMWVRCQLKHAKYLTMGTEYEVLEHSPTLGIKVKTDSGKTDWYGPKVFSEPFDKPKPVFTSADGAPIYAGQTYYRLYHDGTYDELHCNCDSESYKDIYLIAFSTEQAAWKAASDKVKCVRTGEPCLTKGNMYIRLHQGQPTGMVTVINDKDECIGYHEDNFSEVLFTTADGAQKDIKGMMVTCQTDDCKSLTNGKSYKVVQGNYRGDDLVYIHVVNDKGHNQGYYFTTFTDPVPPEEPVFAYCLETAGLWLTKNKGYEILNEDTSKNIIFITNDRGLNKWYDRDMFTVSKPQSVYVKCLIMNGGENITEGKEYYVRFSGPGIIGIINDSDEPDTYPRSWFSTPYTS